VENNKKGTISSFYRTYEELKHFDVAFGERLVEGFYRTYEELKPIPIIQYFNEVFVFIVPMRN